MSDTDSFIDEVNDEIRRDRLFGMFRRYGWIAITAVVLLVGGAGVNEYLKAQDRAKAETLGDSLVAALEAEDAAGRAAALGDLTLEGDAGALAAFLETERALQDDDTAAAAEALSALAGDPDLSPLYRDLAVLGQVLAEGDTTPAADRLAALDPLTAPGAPYRLLALEQQAAIRAETGETAQALAILNDILVDTELTPGLRLRVTQLIVALGGELDAG